ncbi:MAG TPA: DUF1844 domain-containing protein [Terriglobia bacterium]|nr:DUF1844 domain-containing protein [Terriglobia bacterium]
MPPRKDQDEEPQEFRVVDRRPFTAEGELRKDLPPEPAPPPPPSAAKTAPAEAASPEATAKRDARPPGGEGPVQLEHLIMSLVTTAMLHLGMAARPGEAPLPPNLPAARETIDLLSVLQEKTKGNLTRQEEQLLVGSLQELKLAYVEITRHAGRMR